MLDFSRNLNPRFQGFQVENDPLKIPSKVALQSFTLIEHANNFSFQILKDKSVHKPEEEVTLKNYPYKILGFAEEDYNEKDAPEEKATIKKISCMRKHKFSEESEFSNEFADNEEQEES